MKGKVLVAMSGGVDSSVAALLLKRAGYEVYGFFMNASPSGKTMWPSSIEWQKEEKTLREICERIGVRELFVVDCEQGYENKIIKPMFKDYSRGLTPNPDILCNNLGKFPGLMKKAREIGADFIATGHYARVRKRGAKFELLKGMDEEKDQSYFLVGLDQKILRKCLFPLGEMTKGEVRRIAKRAGFSNWDKHGSRGICYLGQIDLKDFLKQRIKEKEGKVVDSSGVVVGKHPGMTFFTIGERVGERKGFEIYSSYRNKIGHAKLFVAAKKKGNVLVVAPEGSTLLRRRKIYVNGLKFISGVEPGAMSGRIRHLGELNRGVLRKIGSRWVFEFLKGVEGLAEGQWIVLYKGEKVVGGGEIRLK